ncbi:MAG: hypothetical protein ACFCD0_16955 [Gemmataceae bacterium]
MVLHLTIGAYLQVWCSRGPDQFVAAVEPTFHAEPKRLLFDAPVTIDNAKLSADLRGHGFYFNKSYHFDYLGHREKWFMDRTGHWVVMTSDGKIWNTEGGNKGDRVVDEVTPLAYDDPGLLLNQQLTVTDQDHMDLSVVRQQLGLYVNGELYRDSLGREEIWVMSRDGRWHFLTPGGNLYEWNGEFETSPLVATLNPLVFADLDLLLKPTLEDLSPGSLGQRQVLQDQYDLYYFQSYYFHESARQKKWIVSGVERVWFYITSDGDIYRQGRNGNQAEFVMNVDRFFFDDPTLMFRTV